MNVKTKEILSYSFLNFGMGARNPYEGVLDRAGFFGNFFCPQNWENVPKMGLKQGFLILLKNVVINS